ncbi:PAAR domain-containing protein [Pseudomonas syringae pv. actinidifoliorum]|nr:PAAR domain-containing protein [Pseudomonas syringae]NAS98538.1 PAAR domain-containing protein [Pseudomonas syringae pv. actinidifoliorum]NAT60907.1 PAAR domain-containing protein [Pseudomonas syringae pv. actinidifoliorum]NAT65759.1 PAAR domain-containing protein [Pseudomonas syringae pv. actinidifoliorum]
MKLLAIVQGDTTDHGGSVINGDQTKRINGFPVAHRGCDVICPLHGTSKIIGEKNNTTRQLKNHFNTEYIGFTFEITITLMNCTTWGPEQNVYSNDSEPPRW